MTLSLHRKPVSMMICMTLAAVLFSAQVMAQEMFKHGISWDILMTLDGKYPSDEASAAVLDPPLRELLKDKYQEFSDYYQVQTPMEIDNEVLLSTAMASHSGGDFASFALFGMNGDLLAVIKRNSELEYIGSKLLLENPAVVKYLKFYDR
ncbi:MAG: hypothetical protein LBU46_01065 [Candidatus Accumulibacter sp.]|nr:hypothetical protein [Accumulibacter sp.]